MSINRVKIDNTNHTLEAEKLIKIENDTAIGINAGNINTPVYFDNGIAKEINRPFYGEGIVELKPNGLQITAVTESYYNCVWTYSSDQIYLPNEMINATLYAHDDFYMENNGQPMSYTMTIGETNIEHLNNGCFIKMLRHNEVPAVIIATVDNATFNIDNATTVTCPKAGIYLMDHTYFVDFYSTIDKLVLANAELKQIDNYLIDLKSHPDYTKPIIDVDALPYREYREDVFYRIKGKAYVVYNGRKFWEGTPSNVIIVNNGWDLNADNAIEHFDGISRTWYYFVNEDKICCYGDDGVEYTPQEFYEDNYGGIVTKNSDGSFTFPTQEDPSKDRLIIGAFYLVYEPDNYMMYYMNTDTGRWTYVPTIEDSFPFNASKYERINLMKRNGDGNTLSTVTPGVAGGSIAMRTSGGVLRGNTNFSGITSEAEKQQVLVNMQYLENKVIEVESIDYNSHPRTWAPKNRTLPVLRDNQLYIVSGVSANSSAITEAHQLIADPSVSQPTIYRMTFYGYGFYVQTGYHLMLYKNKEFHEICMSIPQVTDGASRENVSLIPPTHMADSMINPVLTPRGWAEAPASGSSEPQIIQEHHIEPIRLAGGATYELKPAHTYRINGGQYQILYNPDGSELTDIGKFSSGDIICGDESIMVSAGNFRGSIMVQTGNMSITNLTPITSRNAEMQPGTYIKNTSSGNNNPCWIWDEYFTSTTVYPNAEQGVF